MQDREIEIKELLTRDSQKLARLHKKVSISVDTGVMCVLVTATTFPLVSIFDL
jgi:hypothetical protein